MKEVTKGKRLLSILLVCMMMLSLVPTVAFAEGGGTVTEVSTYEDLYTAVTRGDASIKLIQDIQYICPSEKEWANIILNFRETQTLDLNNHSLEFWTAADHPSHDIRFNFINISNNCDVTIKNGTIKQINFKASNNHVASGPIEVSGNGKLSLQNVNVENGMTGKGINIKDTADVTICGGTIQSLTGYAVYMRGSSKLTLDGGVELRTNDGCGQPSVGAVYGSPNGSGSLYVGRTSTDNPTLVFEDALLTSGVELGESVFENAFNLNNVDVYFEDTKLETIPKVDSYVSLSVGDVYYFNETSAGYHWISVKLKEGVQGLPAFAHNLRVVKKLTPVTNVTVTHDGGALTEGKNLTNIGVTVNGATLKSMRWCCWDSTLGKWTQFNVSDPIITKADTKYGLWLKVLPNDGETFTKDTKFLYNEIKQDSHLIIDEGAAVVIVDFGTTPTHTFMEIRNTATCTSNGEKTERCTICGLERKSPANALGTGHTAGTTWYADSEEHYRICTVCKQRVDASDHTSNSEGICTVCGYGGCEPANDGAYKHNSTHHWFECNIHEASACPNHNQVEYGLHQSFERGRSQNTDLGEDLHSATERGEIVYDCQNGFLCDICGEYFGETGNHKWVKDTTQSTAEKDVYVCAYNGTKDSRGRTISCNVKEEISILVTEEHEWDYANGATTPASCTADGKTVYPCKAHTNCGKTLEVSISRLEHEYDEAWSKDETHHCHKCKNCDHTQQKYSHIYADAEDTTCNTCEYERQLAKLQFTNKYVISGTVGTPLSSYDGDYWLVGFYLSNDSFKTTPATNEDVSSWFVNMPAGLSAKIYPSVSGITMVSISGTPTEARNEDVVFTIPGNRLTSGNSLTASMHSAGDSKWNITGSGGGTTTYTVTFKGGTGATGTAPTMEAKAADTKFSLPACTFTKEGHTFDGWNDGSSVYLAGAEYTMPANNVAFTATWKENAHTHSLTLEPEQAATHSAKGKQAYYKCSCGKYYEDDTARVEIANLATWGVIEMTPHQLSDWQSDANGHWKKCTIGSCDHKEQEGTHDYADSSDTTCGTCGYERTVAPLTFTVTFNNNGHGTAPDAQNVESGSKATEPADLTAGGWTFGGWYEDATCLVRYDFNEAVTRNITLYAKWSQNITNIAVTITEPALGETPDYNPTFTTTPSGDTLTLDSVYWYKIAVADYTGTDEDRWDEITSSTEVFETGYYYSPEIYFETKDGYVLASGVTANVNGKPHDNTYGGIVYSLTEAYISYTFEPLTTAPMVAIVEGNGQEWTKGTTTGIRFKSTADFLNFTSVEIDGVEIATTNYTVEEGSTIVTLKASFLETLSVGEHTIVIASANDRPEAKFTVKEANTTGGNTGNNGGGTTGENTNQGGNNASDTNTGNKPNQNTSTTSPNTGDSSNVFLWVALLFVSLGGLTTTVVYKKRKTVKE